VLVAIIVGSVVGFCCCIGIIVCVVCVLMKKPAKTTAVMPIHAAQPEVTAQPN